MKLSPSQCMTAYVPKAGGAIAPKPDTLPESSAFSVPLRSGQSLSRSVCQCRYYDAFVYELEEGSSWRGSKSIEAQC